MQNFHEWMSFRNTAQGIENTTGYEFVGTYDTETIPDLKENSDLLDLNDALENIPENFRHQFTGVSEMSAGKSMNENNKEIIWISVNDQGTTYIFEKA